MHMWVDPPIIGQPFGLGGEDISDIIVSPRYEGDSLFPIQRYPVAIHIYRPLDQGVFARERFKPEEIEMIAWGELYRTAEEAVDAAR